MPFHAREMNVHETSQEAMFRTALKAMSMKVSSHPTGNAGVYNILGFAPTDQLGRNGLILRGAAKRNSTL